MCRLLFCILFIFLQITASYSQTNASSSPPNSESGSIYLTVRIRPGVSKEALDYLSKVTVPETITVRYGTSAASILNTHYGSYSQELRVAFLDANPGSFENGKIIEAADDITLPPGPKLMYNVTLRPPNNLTLRQFVQLQLGRSGTRTQETIEQINPTIKGKWDIVVTKPIKLPYVASYVSFELKTTSRREAEAIATHLRSLDRAVIFAGPDYQTNVVPNWSLSGASEVSAECSADSGSEQTGLEDLPNALASIANFPSRTSVIAVADTGIIAAGPPFHFWSNPSPAQKGTIDPAETQCINDTIGCNFLALDEFPIDDCAVPADFHHGTHIAGLASARLYSDPSQLDKRIELMILKVANEKGVIFAGDVAEAIRYASPKNVNILNLSLTGPPGSGISAARRDARNVLFVAAAGNPQSGKGIDLDDPMNGSSTGFPANLTKSLPDNVISVGAVDNSGKKIACFSNYGHDSVDVAAPGVNIVSTVSVTEKRALNGTSQATALVSLLAGLLYSQGITSPEAIKHRIVASTDYSPWLKNKVFAAGTINFTKALQFRSDIVQFKDHIEAGELVSPAEISVSSQPNGIRIRGNIYKVVFNYSDQPDQRIRVTVLRGGKLMHLYADHLGKIKFRTSSGVKELNPDEIVDITFKQPTSAAALR